MTPRIEGGRYVCPACPQRFHALSDKKHHIREDHPKEKQS